MHFPPPMSTPAETKDPRCPRCASDAIEPLGRVSTEGGLIKVDHRCLACGERFSVVREPWL